jgi:hypothetical protein
MSSIRPLLKFVVYLYIKIKKSDQGEIVKMRQVLSIPNTAKIVFR